MLVKNLTAGTLKLRYGSYKKELLPMQINVVDEFKMPAEYIKKVYGSYVQIMTEDKEAEVANENLPNETKGNMETQENKEPVQPANDAAAEEKTDEAADVEGGAADITVEDANNDGGAPDEEGAKDSEEIKEDAEGEGSEAKKEEKAEDKQPAQKKGGRGRKQK